MTIEEAERLIKDMERFIENSENIIEAIEKNAKDELSQKAEEAVDAFYNDYTPQYYKNREGSLYDYIHIDDYNFKIESGAQFASEVWHVMDDVRRMGAAEDEYIYEMTFEHGSHGGYAKTHSVNYRWRIPKSLQPLRFYTQKSRMGQKYKNAKKSTPIKKDLEKAENEFNEKVSLTMQNQIINQCHKFIDKCNGG